jgi:hypothetical protein
MPYFDNIQVYAYLVQFYLRRYCKEFQWRTDGHHFDTVRLRHFEQYNVHQHCQEFNSTLFKNECF